jgi:predicted nuclease of predicted toxin-antitoxin system
LRILFDKNVPYQLRSYLAKHEVQTAAELGWARLINGELLKVAEEQGFAVMVTADQSLEYQQNLRARKLALVVLSTNHIGILEKYPEKLVAAVDAVTEGSYQFITFELPPKQKPRPGPHRFLFSRALPKAYAQMS